MLNLNINLKYSDSFMDNTYVKLDVLWSDSDDFFPKIGSRVTIREVILSAIKVYDTCEIQAVNLFVDDHENMSNIKHHLKVLTGQAEGRRSQSVALITQDKKEQQQILSFFRSEANVTVY